MFCVNQRRVGRSKKLAALQSKVAGKIRELFVYDVVVSEFFLISVDVFDVNGHSDYYSDGVFSFSCRVPARQAAHEEWECQVRGVR